MKSLRVIINTGIVYIFICMVLIVCYIAIYLNPKHKPIKFK